MGNRYAPLFLTAPSPLVQKDYFAQPPIWPHSPHPLHSRHHHLHPLSRRHHSLTSLPSRAPPQPPPHNPEPTSPISTVRNPLTHSLISLQNPPTSELSPYPYIRPTSDQNPPENAIPPAQQPTENTEVLHCCWGFGSWSVLALTEGQIHWDSEFHRGNLVSSSGFLRDDVHANNSQFKRPFGSSLAELVLCAVAICERSQSLRRGLSNS